MIVYGGVEARHSVHHTFMRVTDYGNEKKEGRKNGKQNREKKKRKEKSLCAYPVGIIKKKKKKHIQPVFYCLAFVVVSGDVCSCVRFIGAEGV